MGEYNGAIVHFPVLRPSSALLQSFAPDPLTYCDPPHVRMPEKDNLPGSMFSARHRALVNLANPGKWDSRIFQLSVHLQKSRPYAVHATAVAFWVMYMDTNLELQDVSDIDRGNEHCQGRRLYLAQMSVHIDKHILDMEAKSQDEDPSRRQGAEAWI